MTIPYTNARYGQAFMGYAAANQGLSQTYVYPLPPDQNAYSVGPPAGTYPETLTFEFQTSNYGAGGGVSTSKCALVKDEDDIFYYICSYKSGSNPTEIFIDVYDAPNTDQDQYSPTVPTEYTTDYSQDPIAISGQCWFISRRNDTQIDFILVGDDVNAGMPGAKVVIHQYRWTIGSSTLTYITKYEYLADGTASSLGTSIKGMALIDDQVVILNYVQRTGSPDYFEYYLVEFTIDSGGTNSLFLSGNGKSSYDVAFFPAGETVHVFGIYALNSTQTKNCVGFLGLEWVMDIESQIWSVGVVYGGTGTENYNRLITAYTGRETSAGNCLIWDEYGCNPNTGQVYFRLQYGGSGSDDEDCNECLFGKAGCTPDFIYGTRAYWTLPDNDTYAGWDKTANWGETISYDKDVGEYQQPGWWEAMPLSTWFRFSFPHRTHPSSLLYTTDTDHSFILEWPTLDVTAVDVLSESSVGGSKITEGAGQRNDNGSPLIGYELQDTTWWSVFVDLDGTEYARINTDTGQANNPMTGFIGNYAVYEKTGRWVIYGPMPPPAATVRWQVV